MKITKVCNMARKTLISVYSVLIGISMATTTAYAAASGEVDATSFISTACTVLKSVIILIGAGVGIWGVVNLLEGYGNDNPGSKAQ